MAAGRTLATYATDIFGLPAHINVDVPNNLFAEASLGWTAATAGAPRKPARMTLRHVLGVTATGKRGRRIVATTAADLWTGVANTFDAIANDGSTETFTVTGRVGEKASV
jgi:hypothetical protein